MVTRGPITRALGTALRATAPAKEDAGTVALARQYAALLDNAAPATKYRKTLDGLRAAVAALETVDPLVADEIGAREHLDRVTEALSAHSVASDLGPKLLAALTALGMTPTARRAVMGGQSVPHSGPGDELRKRRDDRAARAAGQ